MSDCDAPSSRRDESESHATLERLQLALRAANVGLWDWNLLTQAIYFSPEWKRLIGYEDHEIPNEFVEWESRLHPEDAGPVRARLKSLIDHVGPKAPVEQEFRFRHKDGSYRWILAHASFQLDAQGRAIRMLGSHVDITERKRAETALQVSEARFRRLMDSNLQGVVFTHINGSITAANDAFLRMVGYTREDLTAGRIRWQDMTPPEYAYLDQRALEELQTTGVCTPFEKEYWRKDGSRVPIYAGAAAFEGSREEGIGFVLDLTKLKQLEAQLRQVQKLEAVGQLAGGVAHDFNNILTIIQGHLSLLEMQGDSAALVRESIGEIRSVIERAANLTRQLLTFSRRQAIQPCALDLHAVITNMARLLQRILGEDISMHLHLSPHDVVVLADAGMLEQVLLNLAVNSRDAMPRGGRLVIETAVEVFDEAAVARLPSARVGEFVCLAITDTGTGIPAEALPHVFEPFFTTKEHDKGTGLGLATVYGIVRQHGGWIAIATTEGSGTTFRIYLARHLAAVPGATTPEELRVVRPGSETILLVEDEPALRALARKLLVQSGYRVFEAASGPAAAVQWQEHGKGIDLLVTDMVMPGGMSGFELGEQLARERPGLPIIYMSGYSPEIAGHREDLVAGVNFLAKPFEMDRLLHAIRHVLDRVSP